MIHAETQYFVIFDCKENRWCSFGPCRFDYFICKHYAEFYLPHRPRLLSRVKRVRTDGFGYVFEKLDLALCFRPRWSPHMAWNSVPFRWIHLICAVFVWEFYFISPVVCLIVGVFLLEHCVPQNLRFSTFRNFTVDSSDIVETRILVFTFALGAYFRSDGSNNCLGVPVGAMLRSTKSTA